MNWAIARNWAKFALLRVPVKAAALFVVPFMSEDKRKNHGVFGVFDATDLSWYNVAVRNGGRNWLRRPTPEYETLPEDIEDETLERLSGFQWRWRRSLDDARFASFRMTWGEPRSKGKLEFYIGWKMDESRKTMGFTFFQLRMKWQGWLVLAWVIYTTWLLTYGS